MNFISSFLEQFFAFHANAFYAIVFFLKKNYLIVVVLAAIAYLVYEELKSERANFVQDDRRMI